jgi:hypothetical protein
MILVSNGCYLVAALVRGEVSQYIRLFHVRAALVKGGTSRLLKHTEVAEAAYAIIEEAAIQRALR